ncbi:unnamed protein product [Diamesa serratosioi]
MTTPKLLTHLKGNTEAISGITFNSTGDQLAASSLDKSVGIYNVHQKNTRCLKFEPGVREIYSVDWSSKNFIAAVGGDRIVYIFETKLHHGSSQNLIAHRSTIRSVHFSSSGNRLITSSDDKMIRLWRMGCDSTESRYYGHTNWVRCAKFSPNDKLIASCSDDKSLKIFDVSSTSCVHTFKDEKSYGTQLAWHPDSNLVAIAQENSRVKIFDLRNQKLVQYYRIFEGAVKCLDFHPSGNFMLTGSTDGVTKILDLLEGRDIFTLKGHNDAVTSVKFSHDGEFFATGSRDKHIMLWKSNLVTSIPENDENYIEEIKNDQKEKNVFNQNDCAKNTSITVDARKSDNYKYDSEDNFEL